jgi:hypothetical protein
MKVQLAKERSQVNKFAQLFNKSIYIERSGVKVTSNSSKKKKLIVFQN